MSRVPTFAPLNLNLPIGQLAAGGRMFQGLTGNPQADLARLGDAYNESYNGVLNLNSALAQNYQGATQQLTGETQAATGQLLDQARAGNAALSSGYGKLSSDVLAGLQGAETSRARDINDQYARALADQQQSLVNRGLGNSTVVDSLARGAASDRDRSLTQLANDFAQTRAGYQSNLGLAGLSDRRQGLGDELQIQSRGNDQALGLGQGFLGFLNSIQAPYPDASMFMALAQQQGLAQQANADRGLLMQQLAAGQRAAQGGGGPGTGAGSGNGEFTSSGAGGGFLGGTGRGLSGPEANYGGGATYFGGGGGDFGLAPPQSFSAQAAGYVPLTGAGVSPGYAKPFVGPLPEGVNFAEAKSGIGSADAGAYKGSGGYDAQAFLDDYLSNGVFGL